MKTELFISDKVKNNMSMKMLEEFGKCFAVTINLSVNSLWLSWHDSEFTKGRLYNEIEMSDDKNEFMPIGIEDESGNVTGFIKVYGWRQKEWTEI